MSIINRYNKLIECLGMSNRYNYDYKDKKRNLDSYISYFLSRMQSMFKYNNLPETIPQRDFELLLQCNGHICITEVNNNLYALCGGMGGEPNVYYMPTIYTVSNPALNFSKNLKIDDDCIVIKSDSMYIGILPLLQRYCSLMVENDISLYRSTINTRLMYILTATTDLTKESAEEFLKNIENGSTGVIGDISLFNNNDLSLLQNTQGKTGIITDLIELQQYIKASLYNEIGLNANYNMKRESINSNESQLNDDMLLPLIDDMLKCRKDGINKVNDMFNTEITVEFNSAWEDNKIELENEQKMEKEGVLIETDTDVE